MINVTVAGAAGRMGKRISALCIGHEEIKLVGAVERKGHEYIGEDLGRVLGLSPIGVTITDNLEDLIDKTDVVVDFTMPQSTLHNLRIVSDASKAAVVGTTGFTKEERAQIMAFTERFPCVMAPNMSVGVNLLLKVLADVAKVLGDDYDVEIMEAHHRLKKDAPSGTALRMAEVIAGALGRNLDEVAVYSRKGLIGERSKKEIGIQCLRAADIVGEHMVMFATEGERIEIIHRASSRDTFAKGAIRAVLWVYGRPPGLYDMMDVLGLRGS